MLSILFFTFSDSLVLGGFPGLGGFRELQEACRSHFNTYHVNSPTPCCRVMAQAALGGNSFLNEERHVVLRMALMPACMKTLPKTFITFTLSHPHKLWRQRQGIPSTNCKAETRIMFVNHHAGTSAHGRRMQSVLSPHRS